MLKKHLNKIFKVRFLDKKFILKKEEGIVVCIIKCRVKIKDDRKWYLTNCQNHIGTHSFTYVGVAKCHEEDTFDEQKGKYIAESKAKAKIYSSIKVILQEIHKELISITVDIKDHVDLYDVYKNRELTHIDEVAHTDATIPNR